MKIAIIGFGAAAIGLVESLKKTDNELHIFEKSRDIYSSSISGIRADGKLFVSSQMGGNLEIDLKLQKKLVDFYLSQIPQSKIEKGHSFRDKTYYNQFYQKGFLPIISDFYHIGTDQLKKVLYKIYEDLRTHKNIHFHFNRKITEIELIANKVIIDNETSFDKVYVAVGRSGHELVNTTVKKFPQLVLNNKKVDLGIRFELPDHIVEDLNSEMYEFKIKYKTKTGYMVRTFCNNPSGYVVTEHYDDFITVNGHSKLKTKSRNTNFAILTTLELTQPFNDPVGYGSHIAQLTNILAGQNKVILQTYESFINSKRTKHLYRVIPTLDTKYYILGDINLAFPRRIVESIIDFLANLNDIVPGITNPDNLVYAPEIKFYSNIIDNDKFENLKFIGDCSGQTRSIIYSTAHGWIMGNELLNQN